LRGILKHDSIWFAAYLKLKKGAKTKGPNKDIIVAFTKRKILELIEAVLKKNLS